MAELTARCVLGSQITVRMDQFHAQEGVQFHGKLADLHYGRLQHAVGVCWRLSMCVEIGHFHQHWENCIEVSIASGAQLEYLITPHV